MDRKTPITLIIMDGYGLAPAGEGNAISAASTPNLDELFKTSSHSKLSASGLDVGLPVGQLGNSEVGHTNIGAGRVVFQELPRITKSIADGDFFENKAIIGAIENCKRNGTALHLMGLLSDGGVHSHLTHLFALIDAAKRADKAQTQQILDRLLERVKENELLIHLAVPYERLESLHEKLIQLREAFRTEHYEDFCVARALCLEEIEILKDFEAITLTNLV